MNQRSRNRSRHAAMPCGQLVERRNGRRIAQHNGDLASARHGRGLALRAGHRLEHGSANDEGEGFAGLRLRVEVGAALVPKDGAEHGAVASRQLGCLGGGHGLALLDMQVVGGGDDGVGEVVGHFGSPWRANPADEPSSHVTSNMSTTILRAGL